MKREASIFRLVLIRDGEVISSRNVRTDIDGQLSLVSKRDQSMKTLEYSWGIRAKELLLDALHREGRLAVETESEATS